MGAEREAKLRWKGETVAGRALLETDEVIFRGESRVVFPFEDLKKVSAKDGWLVLEVAKGRAEIKLGEHAETWAHKIANPKGRVEKLGLLAGSAFAILGDLEEAFLDEAKASGARVDEKAKLVIFAAGGPMDLSRVPALARRIAPDGALWIVFPKGRKDFRDVDVIAAGRAAKLHDVKVARFSETHTALKFVVPKSARK